MEGSNQPMVSAETKQKIAEANTFNLKWLVSTVLAIWPWLLGSVIVALIIGNLYLRYTPPVWRSYAELLITDSKSGGANNGTDVADVLKLNNRKINIDNEIEIIRSRTTMTKVVSQLHLNVNYSIAGRLKETPIYNSAPFELVLADSSDTWYACKVTVTSADGYSLVEGNGKETHARFGDTLNLATGKIVVRKTPIFAVDNVQYTVKVIPVLAAVGAYQVEVNPPMKGASYVTLAMNDLIPQRSIDIINKLMQVYAQNNIQLRNRISDSTYNFINVRIKIVDSELTDIEKDIETFKKAHGIADMSAQSEQLIDASSEAMKNLNSREVELEVIDAITQYIAKIDNQPMILPASLLSNPGISALMEKYNTLNTEVENSLVTNQPNNPITRNLAKQRDDVKQNIISSLASSKHELQLKIDQLKKELGIINDDIRNVPKVERLALEYARKQQIKQDLFIFLLKKREETAIEKAATVSDANPIDPASTVGVVYPNHSRILMMSFLFGLIVPFGVIMLRRALNIKIINKTDILAFTQIPIIGEIGNNADSESIAVRKNSRTIIAEQFRALRTNLQYLLTEKNDKVMMITSSMSGEGKSFIAINLSITLAMSGKKVVIIELDLRKPKISKMLNMENNIGFSNYAIGKSEIKDIIVPSNIEPNLYIIQSGPIPPNPSELILMQRTEELFAYLKEHFDYIIMDTSPFGLVTDAQLLSKYADTTLYIVRQGYTYKQQLNIPNEIYYGGKVQRLSLIINDVVANRGFAYGYGYEESYGYGYGYGYGGYGYGSYGSGYYLSDKKRGLMGLLSKFKRK